MSDSTAPTHGPVASKEEKGGEASTKKGRRVAGIVVIDGDHAYFLPTDLIDRKRNRNKLIFKQIRNAVRGDIAIYPTPNGCEDRFLVYCSDDALVKKDAKFNDVGAYVLDALGLYTISGYPLMEPIVIMRQDEKTLSGDEIDALLWLAKHVTDLMDAADKSETQFPTFKEYVCSHPDIPEAVRKVLWDS